MYKKNLKILIIIPSLRLNSPTKFLPVGVASVMTVLRQNGFDFDVLDIDINNYEDIYVENYINKNKYDVILTGCIVTHYKWVKWLTHTIRKAYPKTSIIVGNSVGGSCPEVFLRNSAANYVVIGEGEMTCLELLNNLKNGLSANTVKSIAYIDDSGRFIQTPKRPSCNINKLPMVDWELLDVKKYLNTSDYAGAEGLVVDESNPPKVMPVSTARGCAFKCTFCHYVFWDDPYRFRKPDSILNEIKRNIDEYGANYINFWDDLSFAGLTQAERMVDAILESDIKFNWNAAIRVDLFGHPRNSFKKRKEVAEKFKKAGCLNVGFSLESGNQKILDMMNKKIKPEYFKEQVKLMKDVGITCSTSVVFGYPIETKDTIKETLDLCYKVGVYPSIGYLLPLPYTGMYQWAKDNGFIKCENQYLDSISERQDLCLNLTKLNDNEIMHEISKGADDLNKRLDLGLKKEKLLKTGGYRKHTKKTARVKNNKRSNVIDPKNMKRNKNDFSFNYSEALFDRDLGV